MASERIQRQIDRLLDQVEEAVELLDWDVVRSRAQAVLALDPENADAVTFLASAERALGGSPSLTIAESVTSEPSAITVPTDDQPSSFAGGRYEVKRFLGEGGKKKVYLAHDTTLDREVAFALIKTEGLDDTSRTRIQREAKAMGRLGSHPLSPTGAELLFEVFSQRYERGSILVTTNLPFDEWTEVFGSERLTGALLDRLTHHVHILEMNGESYRLKRSREGAASQTRDEPHEE